MAPFSWTIRRVPLASIETETGRLVERRAKAGTVVMAVQAPLGRSGHKVLHARVLLRPARKSGLRLLRSAAAVSLALGVRRATGVVCTVRGPGTVLVERDPFGNAFSETKRGRGGVSCVILRVKARCALRSTQLGDLLETSPWPKNTVIVDPRVLLDRTLESLSWVYSEWERGMDGTVAGRVRLVRRPAGDDEIPSGDN